ncbi:MAG: LemA family protein, partial [Chloroflexi bacterium]|nr:LemA family protein [Chloroflexota bacterium]
MCAIGGAVAQHILSDNAGLSWQPFVIASAGFLAVLAAGWVWTVYNSLINLRNRMKQGWSQVDVQLKRRHDLIPNLVKAVEGYRDYESETQRVVTELRGQAEATPPGVSGPDFKGMAPLL